MQPGPITMCGLVLCLGLAVASPARGAESASATTRSTPESLLAAADAAVAAENLALARSLFERLVSQFPAAPEANEARRALKIIAARGSAAGQASQPAPATGDGAIAASSDDDVIVRGEPYSRKTSERLRLSVWEKLDFGVTGFLYGMSVGFSFALSQDTHNASDVLTPVALGAVVYTLGSVAFLQLAHPDRGDLPLALAITSYLPTSALLVASAVDEHPDGQKVAAATAVTGLVSIPIAVLAANRLTLDPGDTQLVRDAGFWGLVLATVGTMGFAGSSDSGGTNYRAPSGRKVAVAGLIGLYGGLGLGLAGAEASEVSLERVRISTWGGYGGAVVGLLLGAAANNGREQDVYRGAAIGALAGLVITFLSTGSVDGIPVETPQRFSWASRLTPTMVEVSGSDGRAHPGLGVGGMLF